MSNVCIYHKNCLDGMAAAWVVWKHFYGSVQLIPAKYGDPLPEGLEGKNVYVVDFSYPLDLMLDLAGRCNLVVMDHHDSAENACKSLVASRQRNARYTCEVVFDQGRSGAMLAWKYFFKDEEPPMGIRFVEDRDLWKFELDMTKEWTAVAFSYPFDVMAFDELIQKDPFLVLEAGETLLRKQRSDVYKISKEHWFIDIDGHKFPVVNSNRNFSSDLGELLNDKYPVAVMYVDSKTGREFSLRSRGFAVNAIAEKFGGGGHVKAAGFILPFKDRRFGKSHLKLRSKGYYWNQLLGLLGIG